jgi:hypothetical protein
MQHQDKTPFNELFMNNEIKTKQDNYKVVGMTRQLRDKDKTKRKTTTTQRQDKPKKTIPKHEDNVISQNEDKKTKTKTR